MRKTFILLLVLLTTATTNAQQAPQPPSGSGAKLIPIGSSSASSLKQIDLACPIKGNWTVRVKKVGGVVIDSDKTFSTGDARYCSRQVDFDLCKKSNPTPDVPCTLIQPLFPRVAACTLAGQQLVSREKTVSLGAWQVLDKDTTIMLTSYVCDRAYKIESCRYWYQNAAVTIFKNAGLLSVDRSVTGEMTDCSIDESAESGYQTKLAKGKQDLAALFQIKQGMWASLCAGSNIICKAKLAQIIGEAQAEANSRLPIEFDGDGQATMKAITAKYDPIAKQRLQ